MKLSNRNLLVTSLSLLLIILTFTTITILKYENKITRYKENEQEYLSLIDKHSKDLFLTQKKLKNIEGSSAFQTALVLTEYGLAENDIVQVANITNNTPLDLETSSILVSYTKKLSIPLAIQLALIENESNFNSNAIGVANDRGLGQIRPITEEWILGKYGHVLDIEYNPERIFEPEYNLACSTLTLYDMFTRYGHENLHKILTEYNRGYGNARKYFDKHKTFTSAYSKGIIESSKEYATLLNLQ